MANLDLILDTHALVWVLQGSPHLGPQQATHVSDRANKIYVSAVSAFELATKHRIGKMPGIGRFLNEIPKVFDQFDFHPLPVTLPHALLAGRLDGDHKDPFDRLLAAQSIVENMAVLTIDRRIAELGAKVMW